MTGRRKALLALLAVAIGAAVVATKVNAPPPLSAEQSAAQDLRYARLARAAKGAMTLRDAMRNPKSFDLSQVWTSKNGATCYEYRAQNGFGGLNAESAIIRVGRTSLDLSKGASDGDFVKLWNNNCVGDAADITADVVKLMQ